MISLRIWLSAISDWEERLNSFLTLWDKDVLKDNGKISAELAKAHALSEFEKYRVVQDKLYRSDFDRMLAELDEITDFCEVDPSKED